jgi:hypothetical protein
MPTQQFDNNALRAIIQRAGLSLPDERLAPLIPAVLAAQAAGDAVAVLLTPDRGPPAFQPPEPSDD